MKADLLRQVCVCVSVCVCVCKMCPGDGHTSSTLTALFLADDLSAEGFAERPGHKVKSRVAYTHTDTHTHTQIKHKSVNAYVCVCVYF